MKIYLKSNILPDIAIDTKKPGNSSGHVSKIMGFVKPSISIDNPIIPIDYAPYGDPSQEEQKRNIFVIGLAATIIVGLALYGLIRMIRG